MPTAPIVYVMKGVINSPPYQQVTWKVYGSADTTGAQSGYTGLINIEVDYTITDDIIYGTAATPIDFAATGPASGDLGGTYPGPTVVGLQGRAISSTFPGSGYVLVWNHPAQQWQPTPSANLLFSGNIVFPKEQIAPTMYQASNEATDGQPLTIQAQNIDSGSFDGGDLILKSGTSAVGTTRDGDISIKRGNRTAFSTSFTNPSFQTNIGMQPPSTNVGDVNITGYSIEGGTKGVVYLQAGDIRLTALGNSNSIGTGNTGQVELVSHSGGQSGTFLVDVANSRVLLDDKLPNFQWEADTASPTITQLELAAQITPPTGKDLLIKAQIGTSNTSGGGSGANGGRLILTSGAGGVFSGSGSNGTAGNVLIQTGGTTQVTVTTTAITINATTVILPNITTSGTASSGGATLPGNPVGFIEVTISGTVRKIPYYAT